MSMTADAPTTPTDAPAADPAGPRRRFWTPVLGYLRPGTTPVDRPERLLPSLVAEPAGYRLTWLGVAAVVLGLYAYFTFALFAPADGGVDQNAYLVGGRMIAEHLSPKYTLPNPYAYVGGMFVRVSPVAEKGGDYYPKYPFGLPLLYAGFFWLKGLMMALPLVNRLGWVRAMQPGVWAFVVSPASAVLAIAGMFLLARQVAGSFAGLLAAIVLATSHIMLVLADNPNSHAACTACVVWGFFLLIRWWQTDRLWRGLLGGFLIGYAATIRYSEALLVLPLGVACLTRLFYARGRTWIELLTTLFVALAVVGYGTQWAAHGWNASIPHLSPQADHGLLADLKRPFAVVANVFAAGSWPRTAGAIVASVAAVAAFLLADRRAWGDGVVVVAAALTVVLFGTQWAAGGFWAPTPSVVHAFAAGSWPRSIAVLFLAAATVAAAIVVPASAWRGYARRIAPGLAWAVPVAVLLLSNQVTLHTWTGYDSTSESAFGNAFTLVKFKHTWEETLRTFTDLGLFFSVPLGVAGLAMAYRKSWQLGLVLTLWAVPGTALYTSYYWSPDRDVAFGRFFLSLFPPVVAGVAICIQDGILAKARGGRLVGRIDGPVEDGATVGSDAAARLGGRAAGRLVPGGGAVLALSRYRLAFENAIGRMSDYEPTGFAGRAWARVRPLFMDGPVEPGEFRPRWSGVPLTVAAGLVVAVAAGVSSYRAYHGMRDGSESGVKTLNEDYRERYNLAATGRHLLDADIPNGSVVFAEGGGGISNALNYLQFLRDWDMYSVDVFSDTGHRRGLPVGAGVAGRPGNGRRGGMFGGGGGGGPGGGGGGPPGMGGGNANANNADPNAAMATPIQAEQQQYHASLYVDGKNDLTTTQLNALQGKVVNDALAKGRRVFLAVNKTVSEGTESTGFFGGGGNGGGRNGRGGNGGGGGGGGGNNGGWGGGGNNGNRGNNRGNGGGGNNGRSTVAHTASATEFEQRLARAGDFTYTVVATWRDAAVVPEKADDDEDSAESRNGGRWGRGFGGGGGGMFNQSTPVVDWQLIEVKRKG